MSPNAQPREPLHWTDAASGLPCLVLSDGCIDCLVGLPPDHRLHGVTLDDTRRAKAEWVEAGVNFCGYLEAVPTPGCPWCERTATCWWVGYRSGARVMPALSVTIEVLAFAAAKECCTSLAEFLRQQAERPVVHDA